MSFVMTLAGEMWLGPASASMAAAAAPYITWMSVAAAQAEEVAAHAEAAAGGLRSRVRGDDSPGGDRG